MISAKVIRPVGSAKRVALRFASTASCSKSPSPVVSRMCLPRLPRLPPGPRRPRLHTCCTPILGPNEGLRSNLSTLHPGRSQVVLVFFFWQMLRFDATRQYFSTIDTQQAHLFSRLLCCPSLINQGSSGFRANRGYKCFSYTRCPAAAPFIRV
ncbi:hypothetical protein B0T25DRAFT_63983 [Lasiosphaeria hispida]|uniref:Uncharacterized protein n=1 Tax=Lasiosphaeria hispida TaxID=260671 RepID=A0AAJ0HXC6_9PEZI|nr:hypothetical protein B0T25DRAFT_63983 [Lasiosphaeria hispida]